MVSIATFVLTVFHPGHYFKQMQSQAVISEKDVGSNQELSLRAQEKV